MDKTQKGILSQIESPALEYGSVTEEDLIELAKQEFSKYKEVIVGYGPFGPIYKLEKI